MSEKIIGIDLEKVATIQKLEIPDHVSLLKRFLDATSHYRRFIYFYTIVVASLTHLTKKIDIPRASTKECTKALIR